MEEIRMGDGRFFINSLPKEKITFELCYETIKMDKMRFKFVPYKYRTNELLALMKHFNGVIKFIPPELKTFEICLDAVKRNCYDLKYVPKKFKTKELCISAVIHSRWALKYVPKKLITKEFFELINMDYEEGIKFYERTHKKYIAEVMEMTLLRKHETGLPVNIWVYEGGPYNRNENLKRIEFQVDKSDQPNFNSMVPMFISENPTTNYEPGIDLSQNDIDLVKKFVILNLDILYKLGDTIGIIDFCKQMKRIK